LFRRITAAPRKRLSRSIAIGVYRASPNPNRVRNRHIHYPLLSRIAISPDRACRYSCVAISSDRGAKRISKHAEGVDRNAVIS
jgi:hypothetical protein